MTERVYEVSYQVATYKGIILVVADENVGNEYIETKAKKQLIEECKSLPIGYQSFRVVGVLE